MAFTYGHINEITGGSDPTGGTNLGLWVDVSIAWTNTDGTSQNTDFWVSIADTDSKKQIQNKVKSAYAAEFPTLPALLLLLGFR